MPAKARNAHGSSRSAPTPEPLPPEALRWRCDESALPFESTAQVEPVTGVIGQETAVDALRFGLEINAPGQNVFVRGLTGTGRMTLIRRLLEEIRLECPLANDRCYVHNFSQPDRPRLITLPRGQAKGFRRVVNELADFIRDDLYGALRSEGNQARRSALDRDAQRRIDEIIEPFEQSLQEAGLSLTTVQTGPMAQAALFPVVNGKALTPEEWEQMRASGKIPAEEVVSFKERHARFQGQLRDIMARVNEVRRDHGEAVRALRDEAARLVLQPLIEKIVTQYPQESIKTFLDELLEDVAADFGRDTEVEEEDDVTRKYRVNVVLSHDRDASCPIIIENTPTIGNLLGAVDQELTAHGQGHSDHHMIHAGSLLRADGGYLILDASDVFREAGAWKVLVRTLRTSRLEMVPPEIVLPWWAPSLKPEPIDINIKVILLGDAQAYYLLDEFDPDFPHLFKVLADFDSSIPRDEDGIAKYAGVLARIVREEKLPHFDRSAMAELIEHGARIAGRKNRLTTRFGRLADIAREAAFVARKAGRQGVEREHVALAIRRSKQRAHLPSKQYRELLADGTIKVATSGTAVGQINGLAVIHAGPLTYGFPTRITATIGPGAAGMVNIEREAELSGAIHTKGFYILSGLLMHLLRVDHPFAFSASIAFEQSYGGIDGDSASAAEMCCLLSALTEIPLRQDLAITGAIDQKGNILAVGATNEKIEGFFDVCRDAGLTGTQGVIVPASNANDLMLRADVVEACREGRFHVSSVDSIHAALELLTGVVAGHRNAAGAYPAGTLLAAATKRSSEYWEKACEGAKGS